MNRRRLLSLLSCVPFLTIAKKAQANPLLERNLLVIFCRGGWDTTMVFDPHFSSEDVDSPENSDWREEGGIAFASSPNRPEVDDFFAQHAQRSVIVNGIAVGSISHNKCEELLFTGARGASATDLPTMISTTRDTLLPHVILSGPRIPGNHGSVVTPLDSLFSSLLQPQSQRDVLLHSYLAQQNQADNRLHEEYQNSLSRKAALSEYSGLISISQNPSFLEQVDLAISLFSNGISSCATIQMDLPQRVGWDSHIDNSGNQSQCFAHLFSRLRTVLNKIQSNTSPNGTPLLQNTVVAVLSEMGRTPKYNQSMGKDHWPYTSALFISDILKGGRVIGASDSHLVGSPINFYTGLPAEDGEVLSANHLLAGLLDGFGVDPSSFFPNTPVFQGLF